MFATLLGPLPRPPLPADAPPEALLDACLEPQVEHGLEPVIDAGWPLPSESASARWRSTAARTGRLVKATLEGPISSGRPADAVRAEILRLADAGCRWVEIREPMLVHLAGDPDECARFADAHRELTADLDPELHLSLAITGGNADRAGIATVLAGTYASLAVDLIAGPDNWRLIAAAPTERGIICGALPTDPSGDEGPEMLVWAAGYAASTAGRGIARVGLATSGSLDGASWEVAVRKVRRLGEAARIAVAPREARRQALDPRAVDIRSAALGRVEPQTESNDPTG
jgi:hypothetical protein